jgi:hypothetical protein
MATGPPALTIRRRSQGCFGPEEDAPLNRPALCFGTFADKRHVRLHMKLIKFQQSTRQKYARRLQVPQWVRPGKAIAHLQA